MLEGLVILCDDKLSNFVMTWKNERMIGLEFLRALSKTTTNSKSSFFTNERSDTKQRRASVDWQLLLQKINFFRETFFLRDLDACV